MATQVIPTDTNVLDSGGIGHADRANIVRAPLDEDSKHFNALALAGATFGLIGCVYQALGVMPILGIVFSTLGIVGFDERTEKMRWMASFGLGLSILVSLLSFR
jgi:hypothetical protein